MEHFCTLFDIAFLPQGMALYASLQKHAKPFALWVLCMDEAAEDALKRLALEDLRILSLRDIETPALLAVKSGRSRGEYCWTLTPFLPKLVMDIDASAQRVTYVDADCWFINDPRRIFQEMDDARKDVLITPHGFLPEHDQSKTNGFFCVQFMPFRRTAKGLEVLSWWQERCLEWCFARNEEGLFGDQKYLDQWPQLFPNTVHVLGNTQLTLAPWNAARYGTAIDLKQKSCMYHFHSLRIFQGWIVCWALGGGYFLPESILKTFYRPYLRYLGQSKRALLKKEIKIFLPSTEPEWNAYVRLRDLFWRIQKKNGRIWGRIW